MTTYYPHWNEKNIEEVFQRYGVVHQVRVLKFSQKHREFLVSYNLVADAKAAFQQLSQNKKLMFKMKLGEWDPLPLKPNGLASEGGAAVEVYGVPFATTKYDIVKMFGGYGTVVSVSRLQRDAFEVIFETWASAHKAVLGLDRRVMDDREITVIISEQ